jgi:hypothetical protein
LDLAFVGGAGHSGVGPVARLIGCLSRYATLPIELGFHCGRRGIPDLLEGRVTVAGFVGAMRGRWWEGDGGEGLARIVTRERLEAALGRFELTFRDDPVGACRGLVLELLEPFTEGAHQAGVVERSPGCLEGATMLDRMFPEARFVHAVRDGRQVAAARAGEQPCSAELVEGIEHWAQELRRIDAGVRVMEEGVAYGVWPGRLLVVPVCELAAGDRERRYPDLLAFLGAEDEPGARSFLERELSGALEAGSWDGGLGRWERRRVERRYGRTVEELAEDGVHCAPELIAAYERS